MTECDEIYGILATRGDTCHIFSSLNMAIQTALVTGSGTFDTKSGVMKLCLVAYF